MWELDCEESWVLKNWCFWTVVLEKTLESPLDCKEIQPVHPKDQSWVFIGRTDVEAETLIIGNLMRRADSFERPWLWERLKAGGEGNDGGWDGWMASLTLWTWVWVNSGSWWWAGRPGMVRSMGSQRVRDNWATELNWTDTYLQVSYLSSNLESKIVPKTCAWLLDSQHLWVGYSEATNLEFSVYQSFVSKCVCIHNSHTHVCI